MVDIHQITTFLGWCSIINIGLLVLATLFLYRFKEFAVQFHSKLTAVSPAQLPSLYFSYLAHYKIAILLFNLTPYMALKLMF
ncbi:DUF6868 family protein [Vibrio rarus]|uniref:DUF6868 family protein n=1 Tax=Vibrio rarus TaxID=413403 RepID=UPI0021C37200|nr:hypothetical protein [Vibrio rarus]